MVFKRKWHNIRNCVRKLFWLVESERIGSPKVAAGKSFKIRWNYRPRAIRNYFQRCLRFGKNVQYIECQYKIWMELQLTGSRRKQAQNRWAVHQISLSAQNVFYLERSFKQLHDCHFKNLDVSICFAGVSWCQTICVFAHLSNKVPEARRWQLCALESNGGQFAHFSYGSRWGNGFLMGEIISREPRHPWMFLSARAFSVLLMRMSELSQQ